MHKEAERICRQLRNVNGLCISLVNQGDIHGKKGDKEIQVRMVEEALSMAQEHGLNALALQIERILKQITGG